MSKSLEERLQTHSSAFDGLLSLIPAKYYYDDATQDQWQQQKKSKKEIQQNKRAKLDPTSKDNADDYTNSHASAKDVMANKAKVAKKVTLPSAHKFKQAVKEEEEEDDDSDVEIPDMDVSDGDEDEEEKEQQQNEAENSESEPFIKEHTSLIFDDEGNEVVPEITGKNSANKSNVSPEEQKKKDENLAKLRAKLSDKINKLKEKRKAPGTKLPGAPKSRDQILAERKKKDELKRLEKLKRKSEHLDEEEEESDSGSESETETASKKDQVLFGNIVFNDGSRVTSDLSRLRNTAEKRKQKGPANNDLKAHLLKLEAKKQRLADLTPEEQAKQKSKDQWQRALAQVEGVKVKDDEKLLKKAIKRKEKQKLKSEIEWRERKQIVKDTVSARAKRREENLKSRRENKGKKSKNQPKLRKFTGTINKAAAVKKKRAGFEGTAKSKKK
ncbi:ribosomal RNA-processing protein 14 [[Candida] anglica]